MKKIKSLKGDTEGFCEEEKKLQKQIKCDRFYTHKNMIDEFYTLMIRLNANTCISIVISTAMDAYKHLHPNPRNL